MSTYHQDKYRLEFHHFYFSHTDPRSDTYIHLGRGGLLLQLKYRHYISEICSYPPKNLYIMEIRICWLQKQSMLQKASNITLINYIGNGIYYVDGKGIVC